MKFFQVIVKADPLWKIRGFRIPYLKEFKFNIGAESQEDLADKICGKDSDSLKQGWISPTSKSRRVKFKLDNIEQWLLRDNHSITDWFLKFLRESNANKEFRYLSPAKYDTIPPTGKLEPDHKNNGLTSIQIKPKENPSLPYWVEEDGKWKQIQRKDIKESFEDNYVNNNEVLLVEKIVNYDANMIGLCTDIYEKFNIDFDINEEGEVTLKAADGCINESQSLLDAKEYVKSHLNEDDYTQILFV